MEETQIKTNKNLWPWILGAAAIAVLAAFLFGPRLAASYYYRKGIEFYFKDNIGGTYFKEAEANFTRSLKFDSQNPAAHMYLGRIKLGRVDRNGLEYYPDADWASALPHYEKALDLGIENVSEGFYGHTLENLGHSYYRIGQYEKAREMYLRKIERFPDFFFGDRFERNTFWPRFLTAEMDFEHLNRPKEALELLLPIAAPENADPTHLYRVYTLLSRLYFYLDDFVNAKKYAELALEEAEPGKDAVTIAIAQLMLAVVSGLDKNFAKMETEIKQAEKLAGSAGNFECVRANAYYLGEEYAKALDIAKAAKTSSIPYIKSICLRTLADSYLALGKKSEAKQYIVEYMSLTDGFPNKNIFTLRDRERFKKELEDL